MTFPGKTGMNTAATAFYIFMLVLAVVFGCTSHPSPDWIVQQYATAFNSHDVDSLMSFYDDDIVFDIPDMSIHLTGKKALRGLAEYDFALNKVMTLSVLEVIDDSVFCSITESNRWTDAAGISAFHYPWAKFVVSGGKISYIYAGISDSSKAQFNAVFTPFIFWVAQNHPEMMTLLIPGGKFVYTGESGRRAVALLEEWKQSQR